MTYIAYYVVYFVAVLTCIALCGCMYLIRKGLRAYLTHTRA